MAERPMVKASSTSPVLGGGVVDRTAPSMPDLRPDLRPDLNTHEPRRRGLAIRLVRRVARARKWRLIFLALVTTMAVLASVVYFGPVSLGSGAQLQNARLTSVDGTFLAEIRPEQNRVVVQLDHIPKIVQNAFIAAEDERFWSHIGIDPIAIMRAIGANASGTRQGASTITQQFVRNNETLKIGSKKSLGRKLREAIASIRIERKYSKRYILAGYLNSIYLGNGAYGVQAASLLYFGIDIANVSIEQAALLAGITASPTRFDPRRFPTRARARRNYVLGRMLVLHYITPAQRIEAGTRPVATIKPAAQISVAPGFVDWVRNQLKSQLDEDALYRGGLQVKTSLDLDVQREAEAAVAETLDRPNDPEAAVVVVDVATGGVRAMYGGRNKKLGDLNLATQAHRQAGSAFKPFVLAAALDQGKTLEDRYRGPGTIRLALPGAQAWKVSNYDRRGRGYLTLKRALAYSVNTVFAQLIRDVGPDNVARMAKKAGVESELRAVHSLALGTSEVTPLDLATGYATFAREGELKRTTGLARVDNAEGARLYTNETSEDRRGRQAISPQVASDVIEAMKEVVARGTGRVAKLAGCTTWGKTGTTEDHADAWFVGGGCGAVAVVWVGYPRGRVPMTNVHGIEVVGSSFPAKIWKRVMTALVDKYKPADDEAAPKTLGRSGSGRHRRTGPTDEPTAGPVDEPTDEPSPAPTKCLLVICSRA